jgi:hypothetical protein
MKSDGNFFQFSNAILLKRKNICTLLFAQRMQGCCRISLEAEIRTDWPVWRSSVAGIGAKTQNISALMLPIEPNPLLLQLQSVSERTRAGVKAAKSRGVKFGRKPKLAPQQIDRARKLIDDGQRREDVAALLNVNRATLYRTLGV